MHSTDAPGQESDVSFRTELAEKVRVSDIALMLTVPLVLTAVYLLPASVQQAFILDYGNPSILNLWSSAYVHRGFAHYSNNLVAYCLMIAPTYLLFVLAGDRRLFRYTFISFLFVLPPVIAVINIAVFGHGTGAGFSGIGSAFVGLLPVALVVFIHNRVSTKMDPSNGVILFLVAAGIITMIYVGLVEGAGVILTSGFLAIFHIRRDGVDEVRQEMSRLMSMNGYFQLMLFAVLLFLLSPMLLFPKEIAQDGHLVNIIAHYAGLVLGFFGPTAFLYGRG